MKLMIISTKFGGKIGGVIPRKGLAKRKWQRSRHWNTATFSKALVPIPPNERS